MNAGLPPAGYPLAPVSHLISSPGLMPCLQQEQVPSPSLQLLLPFQSNRPLIEAKLSAIILRSSRFVGFGTLVKTLKKTMIKDSERRACSCAKDALSGEIKKIV